MLASLAIWVVLNDEHKMTLNNSQQNKNTWLNHLPLALYLTRNTIKSAVLLLTRIDAYIIGHLLSVFDKELKSHQYYRERQCNQNQFSCFKKKNDSKSFQIERSTY